jgi:hypothetical protein
VPPVSDFCSCCMSRTCLHAVHCVGCVGPVIVVGKVQWVCAQCMVASFLGSDRCGNLFPLVVVR